MSTMKKRIPMFLLALAMMVAMALPTFADVNIGSQGYYVFRTPNNNRLYLNPETQVHYKVDALHYIKHHSGEMISFFLAIVSKMGK